MAKKKINILLLVVVLGLWGTVTYRYLNRFFRNDDAQELAVSQQKTATFTARSKDTFELVSVARDPFLNRLTAEKKPAAIRHYRPAVAKKEAKPVVEIPFPEVGYFGYVKSGQQKELVVLRINGKLTKLHAGESRDGFKVVKIHKDSVQITAGKQTKYIRRKK